MADSQDLPELTAFLASIPLFAALDEAIRAELARELEPVDVTAGEVIFREGDAGDGFFVVVSGRLRVSVAADGPEAGGPERVLYDLGRGAIVGEMALVTDRPRAATVHAVRDSDLLLLRVSSFRSLLERSPALVSGVMRLLADRLLAVDRLLTEDRRRARAPSRWPAPGRIPGRPWRSPGNWRRNWRARVLSCGWTPAPSTGSWARARRSGRRATRAGPSSSGGCTGWNATMITWCTNPTDRTRSGAGSA